MDTNKMRAEFEASPKFRGMDFTRSSTHPEFYESPYANGAWDGWQASREAVVVQLPATGTLLAPGWNQGVRACGEAIEAQGLKVKS
ncbi:hypothetical protein [Pseudomonas cremoricolorata]|uniref:hypothetical protein n=1 Tax=Pseudomonas cremoricolorata TaxID=157783 RepID=UPI00056F3D53|nr:hypothetical protein [Pseudomonas cremoricolorata]